MAIVTVGGINSRLASLEGNTYRKNEVFTQTQVNEKLIGSAIPNAANLDSYQSVGDYYQASNAQAGTGSNYPPNMVLAGHLKVEKAAGIIQTYKHYDLGRIAIRTLYDNRWSNWAEFYSNQLKPTAADVGALTQAQGDIRYIQAANAPKGSLSGMIRLPEWGYTSSSHGKGTHDTGVRTINFTDHSEPTVAIVDIYFTFDVRGMNSGTERANVTLSNGGTLTLIKKEYVAQDGAVPATTDIVVNSLALGTTKVYRTLHSYLLEIPANTAPKIAINATSVSADNNRYVSMRIFGVITRITQSPNFMSIT